MNNILMLSFSYPPIGGSGTQRFLKFTKYLPENGWRPIVVSADYKYYPVRDFSLIKDIPAEAVVIRTKMLARVHDIPKTGQQIQNDILNKGNILGRINRIVRDNFLVPDTFIRWMPFALANAIKALKKYNIKILFSTGDPFSTHLTALILKKKYGLLWIADFRDSWMEFQARPKYNFFRNFIESKMERSVIKNADRAITASPGIEDKLKNKYKEYSGKISCIPNGFDGNDFSRKIEGNKEKGNKITFLHSGTLWDTRKPEIIINVIERIMQEHKNVYFKFIGLNFISESLIEKFRDKSEQIMISSYIEHDSILKELLSADVLVLMQSRLSLESYPGKMFEYIASKKLVLLIGPENGCAYKLLKKYGKFVFAIPENQEDIYEKIKYIINNIGDLSKINPDENFIDKYDRRTLARRLVSAIEDLGKDEKQYEKRA